jgi:hypothetical protein
MKKITYQTRRVRSCFNRVIELNQKMLIFKIFVTKSVFLCDLPPVTSVSHLCGHSKLPCVEVSHPKTINIKQYLSTDNFSVNNRHVVIKSCL